MQPGRQRAPALVTVAVRDLVARAARDTEAPVGAASGVVEGAGAAAAAGAVVGDAAGGGDFVGVDVGDDSGSCELAACVIAPLAIKGVRGYRQVFNLALLVPSSDRVSHKCPDESSIRALRLYKGVYRAFTAPLEERRQPLQSRGA